MVYVDNVNPGAKPGVTVPQLVDDLVGQGVKIVFTTSDDFKDGTLEAAIKHPDLPIVNVSGDHAWKDGKDFKAPKNLSNFMGRMEYGKMIAGCAAAADFADRQDRLSRPPDQRRDAAPDRFGVPGRPLLLD
ncbi:hypothetical protein [Candidatus Amarobacter glycogenicus]|uniref:hypothetical protein n=1 Tax=Candidatus Amarobacter glycogenicus TaxID=3140699 RepID=UPI0031CCAE0D